MHLFVVAHNYRPTYLVVGDGDVKLYKCERCMFKEPLICFEPKRFLLVNLDSVE